MLFDVKSPKTTFWGLSAKEVIYHIERGNLSFASQIFHPMKQRWEEIYLNHPLSLELGKKLSGKPLSYNYESLFHHWSLKNFLSRQGYFTLMEVVEKLQSNEVKKNSMINHPTVKTWVTIDSLEVFSEPSIAALYKIRGLQQFFETRKDPRRET